MRRPADLPLFLKKGIFTSPRGRSPTVGVFHGQQNLTEEVHSMLRAIKTEATEIKLLSHCVARPSRSGPSLAIRTFQCGPQTFHGVCAHALWGNKLSFVANAIVLVVLIVKFVVNVQFVCPDDE